jgi:hypothetical protein
MIHTRFTLRFWREDSNYVKTDRFCFHFRSLGLDGQAYTAVGYAQGGEPVFASFLTLLNIFSPFFRKLFGAAVI